jgi:hypothetical protein
MEKILQYELKLLTYKPVLQWVKVKQSDKK